ncbi:uncharacterized protein Dyak_GE28296, isoform C [Drosophila yakuba]|uniref:Uncharacterized protein, isoform C n=1 Tax=Drosophila yakuba TaxID=7245 RepID=A0A0R1E413_DROYA|nr:uncharacterized protein Dyak_GE28296, isoform C [Drosophila yakuba]
MGGVDLLDYLLGLYRIQLRSRNWYKNIFFHMIDMCVVNSWILYRPPVQGRKKKEARASWDDSNCIADYKQGRCKRETVVC